MIVMDSNIVTARSLISSLTSKAEQVEDGFLKTESSYVVREVKERYRKRKA